MAMRQMEPTEVNVGDKIFYITPFPAFKAANLTGELASVLAPILGAIAPLVGDDGSDTDEEGNKTSRDLMDVDAVKAAEAISGCSAISGDKLEKLMKKLLLGGHIVVEVPDEDGEIEPQRMDDDIANEIFCGDVQDMFVLCFHVIRLNFNGFFKRFAAPSGKAKGVAKKQRKIL